MTQPKEEAILFDTYEVESLKGGGGSGGLVDDLN
jgi:hypothetical protein